MRVAQVVQGVGCRRVARLLGRATMVARGREYSKLRLVEANRVRVARCYPGLQVPAHFSAGLLVGVPPPCSNAVTSCFRMWLQILLEPSAAAGTL